VKAGGQKAHLNKPHWAAIVYVSLYDGRAARCAKNGVSLMVAVDEPLEDYLPRPAPLFRPSRIVLEIGLCLESDVCFAWLARECCTV